MSSSAAASGANSATQGSCEARTCRSPRPNRAAVRTSDADRPHHQLLAAKPCQQQYRTRRTRQAAGRRNRFCCRCRCARPRRRGRPPIARRVTAPGQGEDTAHAVEAVGRHRAFVVGRASPAPAAWPANLLADKGLLVGRTGDERAVAIEHHHRRAGMLRGGRRQVADPLQIDHREHDAFDGAVLADDGIGGNQTGHLVDLIDEIIAEREFARMQRALKMRSIGNIQADRQGFGRARDAAIGAGDRDVADPRNFRRHVRPKCDCSSTRPTGSLA